MFNEQLRAQRTAERIHALPARLIYELLNEIGRVHGISDDVWSMAERYAQADPDILRLVGADRFPRRLFVAEAV